MTRGVVRIHWALTLHKHLQACADPGRNIAMELNTGYGSRDIKTSLRQVFGFKSVLIQVTGQVRQVLTTWINVTILGHMDL